MTEDLDKFERFRLSLDERANKDSSGRSGSWSKQKTKRSALNSSNTSKGIRSSVADVAILTALAEPEFSELKSVFPELQRLASGSKLFEYWYGELEAPDGETVTMIAGHQTEMGMTAAAYHVADMVKFKPKLMIMSGICAGVEGESKLGDIIVPSAVFDYGSGKIKNGRFRPDHRQVDIGAVTINRAQTVFRELGNESFTDGFKGGATPDASRCTLNVNPMASGAAVVADADVVDQIVTAQRKLAALEMEAYGFAKASRTLLPEAEILVAKVVCDLANEAKSDGIQKYCAYVSAKFCRKFIEDGLAI